MGTPCVEFYRAQKWNAAGSRREYAWGLRSSNGQIIMTPHESFGSHFNAVRSFRTVANALDMRAVFEVRDAKDVQGSHQMLIDK